jgi:GNAT superfamily N-acetyltransferase
VQLGYAWPADEIAVRLSGFLSMGERGLVAASSPDRVGGPLVGLVTLHITPVLHRPGAVGRLTSLVVDDTARGIGVGRALVHAAEAIFAAQGCAMVEVTSNMRRTDAHAFYEHLGYSGTNLRFTKTLG